MRYLPIVIILLLLSLSGCQNQPGRSGASKNHEMEELFDRATDAASKKDFNVSDSLGRELYDKADFADNDLYRAFGLLAISYSRLKDSDREKRLKYLKQAERIAIELHNDTLATLLYNFMGACTMDSFDQARHYFTIAMETARRAGIKEREIMAECNLAEIYRLSSDTLGIKYDLDIYRYALEADNQVMLRAATVRCVEYYLRRNELQSALPFIAQLKKDTNQFYYNYMRSKWLFAADSLDDAIRHWEKANDNGYATPGYLLVGGRLYQAKGDVHRSDSLLKLAEEGYADIDSLNPERIDILMLMANNRHLAGDDDRAFPLMARYAKARDSLRQVYSATQINSYKVKFETDKKEVELAAQKQSLRLRTMTLGAIITLFLIIIVGLILYVRKRNRLFRLVANREKEFINRLDVYSPYVTNKAASETVAENEPESQPAQPETADTPGPGKQAPGIPSPDKAEAIWKAIVNEMEHNRIYADPDITRDTFADRINTNHTWLSAVIKDRTGKSYTQFMNSWRINEAVRILSAGNCDFTNRELAAHLGFMTPQSFYAAFKSQIGMSPAQFRQSNK